ncbi:helix-turn-helix domain-containing protein [Deinococcus fonticola]|uniref:helix-turn-helix domain-containing protein n=1 Tax=Deinococcus fonticola TaxID=2528713 RepID=UPI001074EF79|nr:helix-turn-helix transcriptional regulator [Deinococcus fonticola]
MTAKAEASPARLTFGKKLRAARRAKDMTLEDLAEASGMNWSYISQVESGHRNIAVDNMWKLAQGLGVELRELL